MALIAVAGPGEPLSRRSGHGETPDLHRVETG